MKDFQQILHQADRQRDNPWTLATLVATRGSTYRRPGARLLVAPDGTTTGVLSGGCLEEEIARRGWGVLETGKPELFGIDTRRLFGCEGHLEIFLERIPAAGDAGNFLTRIGEILGRRGVCRTRTCYDEPEGFSEMIPSHELVIERPGIFVQAIPLPVRLLLFGSGPEIAPLRWFAVGLGWKVQEHAHPDELPEDFTPDDQTAAMVMTHQFGRDLAALDRLLPLGLPYLGFLGPRRRQAELLGRLQEYRELEPGWLEALHAPAGLDIGSETPEEIALSIVSEAAAVLAGRRGGFLSERSIPIHAATIGKEA